MKNRGSVLIYSMMISLVIIILALALAPGVVESVTIARGTSGMDCADTTNSNFIKAACVAADLTIFYYVGGVLFIGGAVLGARLIFGGEQ